MEIGGDVLSLLRDDDRGGKRGGSFSLDSSLRCASSKMSASFCSGY